MPKTNAVVQFIKNCKGFDTVINKLKVISAGNGNCVASLIVTEDHTNPMGGLHGGLSATLIDSVSSFALLTHENGECPSVSVNINASYLKGAVVGDEIIIDAKTMKAGRTMAFLDVEIKNKKTGDLLVKGEHTKFLMQGTSFR